MYRDPADSSRSGRSGGYDRASVFHRDSLPLSNLCPPSYGIKDTETVVNEYIGTRLGVGADTEVELSEYLVLLFGSIVRNGYRGSKIGFGETE